MPNFLRYIWFLILITSISVDAMTVDAVEDILYLSIDENKVIHSTEDDIYFYHGDHLGSADWITDANGDAISNDLNKE